MKYWGDVPGNSQTALSVPGCDGVGCPMYRSRVPDGRDHPVAIALLSIGHRRRLRRRPAGRRCRLRRPASDVFRRRRRHGPPTGRWHRRRLRASDRTDRHGAVAPTMPRHRPTSVRSAPSTAPRCTRCRCRSTTPTTGHARRLHVDRGQGVDRGHGHDRRRDLRAGGHPPQGQLLAARPAGRRPAVTRRRRVVSADDPTTDSALADQARRVRRGPAARRADRSGRPVQQLGHGPQRGGGARAARPRRAGLAGRGGHVLQRERQRARPPSGDRATRTTPGWPRARRRRRAVQGGEQRRLHVPRRRPRGVHRGVRPGGRRRQRRPHAAHRVPRLHQQRRRRHVRGGARRAGSTSTPSPPIWRCRSCRQLRRHRRTREQLVPVLRHRDRAVHGGALGLQPRLRCGPWRRPGRRDGAPRAARCRPAERPVGGVPAGGPERRLPGWRPSEVAQPAAPVG